MVTLGRLSRGLTQAELARDLSLTQATLSKIESGVRSVDPSELEAIAMRLGYPVEFFLVRESLDGPGLPELYHERRRKSVRTIVANKAHATATIKRMQVERLLRSWPEPAASFPLLPREEYGDPGQVARTVRAQLELPLGPIFNMTDVVEAAGGIIIECDFESRQIDGFSKWKHPNLPPLFFMNHNVPPDRWRWTLAHELGHVIMHTGHATSPDIEEEADIFAEEFLTPAKLIKSHLLNPTFPNLSGLKIQWKVSIQALINRAYHLQIISSRRRSHMFMQWTKAGFRLREPEELDPPNEPPHRLQEMVDFHLKELGYTIRELSQTLLLDENEFRALYMPSIYRLK